MDCIKRLASKTSAFFKKYDQATKSIVCFSTHIVFTSKLIIFLVTGNWPS